MLASQVDNLAAVKVLLDHGANPNLVAKGPLARYGHSEGYSALMLACQHAAMDVMQALLDHGADMNCVGADGKTVFDIAGEDHLKDQMLKILESHRTKSP
jgi:ankyrin repeat protein